MQLTDKAIENRQKVLPYHDSQLEETDPEFMEIFNNFLFDDVQKNTMLPDRSKMLVILATLIANQSEKEYEIAIEAAINLGLTPVEIKEVLYQSAPYVGFAKLYDFLDITNQVFDEKGIDVPIPGQSTTNRQNRMEMGYQKQLQYFRKEMIEQLDENTPMNQKHFNEFLKGYCFGDFYTRTGLDDQDRELVTFCIIASLGGCENQLRGHTQGNLSVGNDKETLIGALTVLMPFIGFPRTINALAIINESCL
ncbi:MAG: carboxymuconolactone decarboxylase [Methanosphaera sp. rholeuAM6]|nr:MAG: carboxymuconolactone decarboxylase [Methanosphaera sp. rholeuAM6]